jgi:hypothetical protein
MLRRVSVFNIDGRLGSMCWLIEVENDNLRGEYSVLFTDVQKDIPWARIALEKDPEAINLWIGSR